MKKKLDEVIHEILITKFNPQEIARTLVDGKILEIVNLLKGGDSIKVEEIITFVSFENGERFNGYKITVSNKEEPLVLISKEEMLEAFNTLEEAPLDWPLAITCVKHAFYGLPKRSMYFKEGDNGDIQFTTTF